MMERQSTRHFVANALRNDSFFTSKDQKFIPTRTRPVQEERLPIGFVYTDRDRVLEVRGIGTATTPRCEVREFQLTIALLESDPDDTSVEDRLDDASEAVERVVLADTTAGGSVKEILFSDSDSLRDPGGNAVIGTLILVFTVTYLRETSVDGGA
jgi:hypothetical protein